MLYNIENTKYIVFYISIETIKYIMTCYININLFMLFIPVLYMHLNDEFRLLLMNNYFSSQTQEKIERYFIYINICNLLILFLYTILVPNDIRELLKPTYK